MSFKSVITISTFAKNTTYWAGYNSTNIVLLSIATSQTCTCCTTRMIVTGELPDSKLGSSTPDIARYVRLYIIMGSVTAGVGDTYRMRMCAC